MKGIKMSLLNRFRLRNTPKNVIVYKSAPHFRGHAVLIEKEDVRIVAAYGHPEVIDSQGFENLQEKAAKDNIKVLWLPY